MQLTSVRARMLVLVALFSISFVSAKESFARGFASRIVESVEQFQDSTPLTTGINWAQPAAGCIEEFVPKFYSCLDLSQVKNPIADVPPGLSEEDTKFWTVDHRADLNLCRAKEVYRREAAQPGSMSAGDISWAWMWMKQAQNIGAKVDAIYTASEKVKMPPQILFGALKQESLLSDLGITEDGGNFSCGIGQVNIGEWCRYMTTLPGTEQARLGWPVSLPCDSTTLPSDLIRPFYTRALTKLGGRPDYELTPKEFAGIRFEDVVNEFPGGIPEMQKLRFTAATSFVQNCSDSNRGIAAKGEVLRGLFDTAVPAGLRKVQIYPAGKQFARKCQRPAASRYYPLHTGWLLAVATYNAGEREVALLQHYFRMTKATHESGKAWAPLTPTDLIEGLHWGGKWNKTLQKLEFKSAYGTPASQSWFKSCIVQRHIARVVQYATLPGATLATSLEVGGCSRTTVPEYRKKSSGRKGSKKPHNLAVNR